MSKIKFTKIISLTAILLFSISALNTTKAQSTEDEAMPAALQFLADNGAELIYIGDAYGLEAWLAHSSDDNTRQTFYLTPDGDALIAGLMFDGEGKNVTQLQLQELYQRDPQAILPPSQREGATPNHASIEDNLAAANHRPSLNSDEYNLNMRIFEGAENANWFTYGDENAPILYAILDANCPFCARAWDQLEEPVANGDVQVRVIMTGRLHETSLEKAAAILSADDPVEAFNTYHGSRAPVPRGLSPEGARKVSENEDFAHEFDLNLIPTFIYISADGTPIMRDGLPGDIKGQIIDNLQARN